MKGEDLGNCEAERRGHFLIWFLMELMIIYVEGSGLRRPFPPVPTLG